MLLLVVVIVVVVFLAVCFGFINECGSYRDDELMTRWPGGWMIMIMITPEEWSGLALTCCGVGE